MEITRPANIDKKALSKEGLFHLMVVYIVWSSTYLAMRVVVDGGGFTPFAAGASRLLVASSVLFLFAVLRGHSPVLPWREIKILAVSGNMLWLCGNGLVMWGEQWVHSGLAALLVSASPIWTALFEAVEHRQRPSAVMAVSLAVGFGGVIVLMLPTIRMGDAENIFSVLVIALASVCWAVGSYYQSNNPVKANPIVMSAYQQAFAAIGFLVVAFVLGEPLPQPTEKGWLAWGFLVIFGSLWAFTSFVYTLKLLPLPIAMTYAYVNPALALFMGWLILDEPITVYTLAGAALVIAGVVGIFRERYAGK